MSGDTQIMVGLLGVAATVLVAIFTRRSARDTMGVQLITTYIERQDSDMDDLREEVRELKGQVNRVLRQVRVHRPWDQQIYAQARAAGWEVTEPPPLGEDE